MSAADLTAVENRCWTYQRPYTVLEVQHISGANITAPQDARAGYVGVEISGEPKPGGDGPDAGLRLLPRSRG